ncbi:Dynein regulatory complex protein 1, partial [Tinamus guttatus]
REALGEDAEAKKTEEEEKEQRGSHKQVEESRQRLAKLLFEGTQLVTNIQVAADSREAQRRAEEAELKLQSSAQVASQTCPASLEKLSSLQRSVRFRLGDLLTQQQRQCTLLLEEKNKLIGELQQELKSKDEQYVYALRKQSDDIHLLSERMEEQIRNMLKNYRHELLQIEKAFELERRELLDDNKKKWEETIQAHNAQELEDLAARMKKVEEFEKQLNQLHVQGVEEYNTMKSQLESNVQTLEEQLQKVKATYQLNQEKLEYNLQVLKKQDEENTIIKSQQKRKLNRLHDVLNNLRRKLAKQEKQLREENQNLAADYERLVEQCKELQKMMRHFAVSDAEKFTEVWLMNEEEAKGLIRRAFDADRIIHTQQLGLPWEEPRPWFLNNTGPLRDCKTKSSASKLAAELLAEMASGEGGSENPEKAEDRVSPLQNISRKTVKRILELVSDESGFLVESKLLRLLQPLGKHERTLVKLDSIFAALEIDSKDDLYELVDFFLKYRAQDVTVTQLASKPENLQLPGGRRAVGRAQCPSCCLPLPGAQESPAREDPEGLAAAEDGSGSQRCEPTSSRDSLPSVYVRADDILRILKAFVRDFDKLRGKDDSAKDSRRGRDSSKDAEYWDALAHAIPEAKLKLWDALLVALERYHHVLAQRASLIGEVAALQQQNSELCLLLDQYLASKVSGVSSCP